MAEIILGQVGSVVGAALLPQGVSALGLSASGAALGQALGSIAGRALDTALRPPLEGPRLPALHIMESREGVGIPLIYGRMRVAGQVIWAARFLEKRRERSAGKGGPRYTEYSYCLSFAVALCAGVITRLDRIWANGSELQMSELNYRLYTGDEAQLPDPLMEAIEGSGNVPAYRGVSYIVFEDLPLDDFGNRMPQLSFEIVRASMQEADSLSQTVHGVNIIPASGEFVYACTAIHERRFPAISRALNVNNGKGLPDFTLSLEQLQADLPNVRSAALTVAWFGTDLRAGQARLYPGVETAQRQTEPQEWSVDGISRSEAYVISRTDDSPNYGGTPSDRAVLEGIAAMSQAGIALTLSPFLLMDIPEEANLPHPDGVSVQGPFPWRGRITVSGDGSHTARSEIDAFVGDDGAFGFRHFILHHARLAAQAGGVDAFLIGSEMTGLTRIRDETGAFPFVEALQSLAAEVRAIVGPDVRISYAADWTEYGAFVPQDDSGDVLFPLDPLWADPNIDFVGLDWYPPMGDWRDGSEHLDALAGYQAPDDAEYLAANLQGGEAYDWYYASDQDRALQQRTPIADTAHGEDWIFRQKDMLGWWANSHYQRPSGIRDSSATAWRPRMKPIRLIEIGYPAVDRGGNAPNLFYDPKSSESALPPFSRGVQDDLFQRNALAVALPFWQAQPGIEQVLVWAWDGRPWPYYPSLDTVWSDGPNWHFGHWLNGRSGQSLLSEVISDLGHQAHLGFDTASLSGYVEGYVITGPMTLRQALVPLQTIFQFDVQEAEAGLLFHPVNMRSQLCVGAGDWVENGYTQQVTLLDKAPGRLRLHYISSEASYAPSVAEGFNDAGDPAETLDIDVPLVMSQTTAQAQAERLISLSRKRARLNIMLGPDAAIQTPGSVITLGAQDWTIERLEHHGLVQQIQLRETHPPTLTARQVYPVKDVKTAITAGPPECVWIDPCHRASSEPAGPLAAIAANPWTGSVTVRAGIDQVSLTERGRATSAALIGLLRMPVGAGPLGRWDRANHLDVYMPQAALASLSAHQILTGANRLLLEGESDWELLAFEQASLMGEDIWRLSGLLRGLGGSPVQAASLGARVVIYDSNLVALSTEPSEVGLQRVWQAGSATPFTATFNDKAALPPRIGHLSACPTAAGWALSWTRRDKAIAESWALPEADNSGAFRVELWRAQTRLGAYNTLDAYTDIHEPTADYVRIAPYGPDNRLGPWVSILLQTP